MPSSPRFLVTVLAIFVVAAGTISAGTASAAPRGDADHYEFYFPSSDGINKLHADVLRPKGLAMDVPTPVIMTVSPYTNHLGSTGPSTTEATAEGPSPRFYDFLDLSGALTKGYTYVMVDLPGDGGSGGCNDWGGRREQLGVRDAVEWAAEQEWSNGKIALLGKSYDGWTGLMGIHRQPKGLAAVVSLEPVYSGYRYIWMNGITRTNWPYGTSFTTVDAMPGRPTDSPEYQANGAPQGWCYPINIVGHNADNAEDGWYWDERNLVPTSLGKTTPLFLTQGFLETNTKQDGAFQYFNGMAGDAHRAWYGQFDHCRAWETHGACNSRPTSQNPTDQRLAVGRAGFIDEVMRFLDLHLKGITPTVTDPPIEVQDNLGRWRAEASWPPEDMTGYETELRPGTYTDSGSGSGTSPSQTQGIWSISAPLAHDVWFAGEPWLDVTVDGPQNANLAVNVYDIAPPAEPGGNSKVTMISRGVELLRGTGVRTFEVDMYGQDWLIEEGHRVGVLVSSANTDQFRHIATRQPVTVQAATIELPFLTYDRVEFLEGGSTPRLEQYLNAAGSPLTQAFITSAETAFSLPGPLVTPGSDEPIPTSLALDTVKSRGSTIATATLLEELSGLPIAEQEISFYVNDVLVGSAVTDATGKAQVVLRSGQYKTRDVLSAVFAGTDSYEGATAAKAASR